jgi:hypothetical protein
MDCFQQSIKSVLSVWSIWSGKDLKFSLMDVIPCVSDYEIIPIHS